MTINNIFKSISCSSMSLGIWAILSRIAYAAPADEDIKSIQEELSGFFGFLDLDVTIYILSAIAIIALVLSVILLIDAVKNDTINNLKREINKLKQENKNLNDTLEKVEEKITNYCSKQQKFESKSSARFNDFKDVSQEIEVNVEPQENKIEIKPQVEVQMEPQMKPQIDERAEKEKLVRAKIDAFVKEYNQGYADLNESNSRVIRDKLIKDNNIKAFFCENSEARIYDSNLSCIFKDVSGARAEYWAVPIEGDYYAVVPRLGFGYEIQAHETAGMKEVFKSNYQSGMYKYITVIEPAYFEYVNGTWTFAKQGELRLNRQ